MIPSDESAPKAASSDPAEAPGAIGRTDAGALLLLASLWLIAIAWVGIGGDYPLNDDWAYALSAKEFLHSGRMRILDWAAPSLVAHIAWGALCMRLLGESFVSLRVGTLLLALLGAWASYGLGRSLRLSPRQALLSTLALLFSPWYVNLSFTFMSDVPWLVLVLVGLLCFSRALQMTQSGWASLLLFLAGTSLGVAALIRQFAVVLLPALWLTLLVSWLRLQGHPSAKARWGALLSALGTVSLPTIVIYGVFHIWYTRVHGPTLANRETWTRIAQLRGYQQAFHLVAICFYFALWLLPLAFAVLIRQRGPRRYLGTLMPMQAARATLGWLGAGAIVLLVVGLVRYGSTQVPPGETVRPLMPYLSNIVYVLGMGPPVLNAEAYGSTDGGVRWVPWLEPLLTILCLGSAALFSGLFLDSLRRVLRATVACLRAALLRPWDRDALVEPASGLSLVAQVLLLSVSAAYLGWHVLTGPFVFDRYLLPALPLVWFLIIGRMPASLWRGKAPFVALAVWAAVSLLGTRHYLRWNSARAQAIADLRSRGVSVDELDAGFEYNGTWHFEASLRQTGKLDAGLHHWWVPTIRYALSFLPTQSRCQTIARYPYYTLWPGRFPWESGEGSDAIYVLHCPADFEWPSVELGNKAVEEARRTAPKK